MHHWHSQCAYSMQETKNTLDKMINYVKQSTMNRNSLFNVYYLSYKFPQSDLSTYLLSVCLFVCVHYNSKNNCLINLKLEHIVVYENSSKEFYNGLCLNKVKVTA